MPPTLGEDPNEEVDRRPVPGAHQHGRHRRVDRPREPPIGLPREQEQDDEREDQDHDHGGRDHAREGKDPVVPHLGGVHGRHRSALILGP